MLVRIGLVDIAMSEPQREKTPVPTSACRRRMKDQAVDESKQLREAESGFFEKYRVCLIISLWSFCMSINQLSAPFLTKIKSDQLGGEQRAGEIVSIAAGTTAVVGIFTASLFGTLLDTYGRRPFFILASVLNLLVSALTTFLRDRIIVSIVVGSVAGLVQQSYLPAAIADAYSTKMRIRAVSIVIACGSLAALTMILTSFISEDACFYIAFGSTIVSLAVSLFIPETLTEALQRKRDVEQKLLLNNSIIDAPPEEQRRCENPFAAMIHLCKSKVMLSCTAILFFYLMAQVGTGDVYMFYLAERVQFTAQDNAWVMIEAGVLQPLVLLVFVPLALKYVSPILLMLFALGMLIAELVLIATMWALWPVFALGVPIVAFTQVLQPVVLGIVQNSGDERDQGRRMSGLQAVMDLADGVGPLMFGLLFGNLKAALVFLPFVISAGLVVIPIALTFRLTRWIAEEEAKKNADANES